MSGFVKPLHRDIVYSLYSAQLKRNGSPYAPSHFSSSTIKDAVGASRRPNKREQVSRSYPWRSLTIKDERATSQGTRAFRVASRSRSWRRLGISTRVQGLVGGMSWYSAVLCSRRCSYAGLCSAVLLSRKERVRKKRYYRAMLQRDTARRYHTSA